MFFSGHYGLAHYLYQFFQTLIYVAPAAMLAISMHEFAHGYVSYRLGDMTPKLDGRLTLNPFRHLDVWGTLCLLVFHMGWARPVRISTRNYKNPKRDMILVSAAGVITNFILAFVCMLVYGLLYKYGTSGLIVNYLYVLSYYGAILNVGLGVFNLIPIPPLDGSNILAELCPGVKRFYARIRPYSVFLLAGLLGMGVLNVPLQALDSALIDGLWNLVKMILRIGVVATGRGTVL